MKMISKVALTMTLCLTTASVIVLADEAKAVAPKPGAMSARAAKHPAMMTPDQLKWVPNPDAPGVSTAVLWGDPAKGAHGAFHKFPAGWSSPLHTHSNDLRAVVISGTMSQTDESGKETKLPPGSYFYQPNTWKHITKCETGSECVAFVTSTGKFDLKPAGEANGAGKPSEGGKK